LGNSSAIEFSRRIGFLIIPLNGIVASLSSNTCKFSGHIISISLSYQDDWRANFCIISQLLLLVLIGVFQTYVPVDTILNAPLSF